MSDSHSNLSEASVKALVPRSSFRRAWIVTGAVLWALVFAAAIFVARGLHHVATSSSERLPALVVEKPGAEPVGVPSDGSIPSVPSKPPWNDKGIEDFTFTERSGRRVTKADLLGHPWLVCFIFTRCAGPCPKVSTQMSELQTLLKGTDVRLVTLTVDPDFDKPDVLKRYADQYHADPNRWLYLSGDKRKTYELINRSFLMPVQEMTGKDREPGFEVLHSTNILLVNEKGVVVKKYNATNDLEMAALRRDLKPYRTDKQAGGGNLRKGSGTAEKKRP